MLSVKPNRFYMNGAPGGFTLIELMIAIAIVAVLVSLADPVYSGYRIRAKISECINNTAPAKFAISEYRKTYGEWPPSPETAGQVSPGLSHYCNVMSSYESTTGAFSIDVNEPAVDFKLVKISPRMVPTLTRRNVINWKCTPGETVLDEIAFLPPGLPRLLNLINNSLKSTMPIRWIFSLKRGNLQDKHNKQV